LDASAAFALQAKVSRAVKRRESLLAESFPLGRSLRGSFVVGRKMPCAMRASQSAHQ
jgi:hypothetical protein